MVRVLSVVVLHTHRVTVEVLRTCQTTAAAIHPMRRTMVAAICPVRRIRIMVAARTVCMELVRAVCRSWADSGRWVVVPAAMDLQDSLGRLKVR